MHRVVSCYSMTSRSCPRVHQGRSERGMMRVSDADRQTEVESSPSSFCITGAGFGSTTVRIYLTLDDPFSLNELDLVASRVEGKRLNECVPNTSYEMQLKLL